MSSTTTAARIRRGLFGVLATSLGVGMFSIGSAAARSDAPAGGYQGSATLDFEFYRANVEPIFYKDRGLAPGSCVMCHTWQAGTPLSLVPLQEDASGVYWTVEQSRRNFEVVSALVSPGFPDNSRLLRKPLATAAGGTENHVGGKFWDSKDDPEWQILAQWVRNATPGSTPVSTAQPEVDFDFFQSCVQKIFINPVEGAVPCAACHSGGGERGFAPPIPGGRAYWNEEESRRNFGVVMQFVEPGYPLRSLFLQMALHPDAGGTPMHAGGIRWQSQDDPEWQAIAAWIRGEMRGSTCPAALQF